MNLKKILSLTLVVVFVVTFSVMGTSCKTTTVTTTTAATAETTAATAAETTVAAAETTVAGEVAKKDGELRPFVIVMPRAVEILEDVTPWVAAQMGYLKEEGLEMVMMESYGTTDLKMISTKHADIAGPAPSFILSSIEAGMPIKAFFQVDAINIFGMAVRNDSDIKTWKDMKGKTCALGDASWELIINPTLVAAGLDPKQDINYVVVGDTRAAMLDEGKVDMVLTWISEVAAWNGQGLDFRYIDGNEILPCTGNALCASLDTIENDPELLRGVARAWQKGLYFTLCNPEAATDIVLKQFPSIKVSWKGAVPVINGRLNMSLGNTEELRQKFVYENPIGTMFEDGWKVNIKGSLDSGVISKEIPLDRIYTNEFLDKNIDYNKIKADAEAYVFQVKDLERYQ